MYVCICVCKSVYVCMFVTYALPIYFRISDICNYVFIYVCVLTSVFMCVCTYVCLYVCMYLCMNICKYVCR